MVRTRGLHWALSIVLGKALGRQVSGDAQEVPQRQRPTTSACRQRLAAVVAEDVKHVDHSADEVHEQPREPVTDDERTHLKLDSHGRKVKKFGRPAPKIEGLVVATRLSPLITCSSDTGDTGLISPFAERCHKETSSFHLSVGEVTVTFNDVTSLLHLPITGAFHTFDALDIDQVMDLIIELLEVSTQEAKNETSQTRGAYVRLAWLRDIYRSKCDAR
ncbi:Protein MAIN-LIKE 2 [Glycine max]|nr:Protein MAIN-LIKE 2 [Glycine max]